MGQRLGRLVLVANPDGLSAAAQPAPSASRRTETLGADVAFGYGGRMGHSPVPAVVGRSFVPVGRVVRCLFGNDPMRREAVLSLGLWISGTSGLNSGVRGGTAFQRRGPRGPEGRHTGPPTCRSHLGLGRRWRPGKRCIETLARFDGRRWGAVRRVCGGLWWKDLIRREARRA